ncbi:MAG: rhamnan synthesis F family protein [Methylococcaceae bacterium]|nr:rhamnan synthesis F family protein [Methylococcaceae bacterium]
MKSRKRQQQANESSKSGKRPFRAAKPGNANNLPDLEENSPIQLPLQCNLVTIRGGLLEGWVNRGDSQAIRFCLDNSINIYTNPIQFGEDLAEVGIRSGFAAFSVPIPCYLLDGKKHKLEVFPAKTDAATQSVSFASQFDVSDHIKFLERSVVSVTGSIKRIEGQKIALFCGYEPNGMVSSDTYATIKMLQRVGFKVVYILAADYPPADGKLLELPAEINILRKNEGFDFGSWATGYLHMRTKLGRDVPEILLLMNDSMLWTGQSLDAKFLQLNRNGVEIDVLGATESYDPRFHLQSFYLLFSKRVIEQNFLDEFLLYRAAISPTRDDVITKFELNTYNFFASKGLVVAAAVGYQELIAELWPDLMDYLEMHRKMYPAEMLAHFGCIHDVQNWMNAIQKGSPFSPAHTGWLQLNRKGFPFIKKEIVLRNPVHVPFFEQIRSAFHGQALADLDDFVRSHSGSLIPAAVSLTHPTRPFRFQLDAITTEAMPKPFEMAPAIRPELDANTKAKQ